MLKLKLSLLLASVVTFGLLGCGGKNSGKGTGTGADAGGDPNATYTVKISSGKAGEKVTVESSKTKDELQIGAPNEKPTKKPITEKASYSEEIITADEKTGPSKFKRTYSKAEVTKNDKTETLSYSGKTITFEKKNGAYVTDPADNGKDQFQLLASIGSKGSLTEKLMPTKPVKVGETWDIPESALDDGASKGPKPTSFKASGKLTKAYQKDGKQFGVVVFNIDATLGEGASIKAEMTYDGCIDGSVCQGTMKGTSTVNFGSQEMSENMEETRTPAK